MNPFKLKEMMQAAKTMSTNMQGIQSKLAETPAQGHSPGKEVTIIGYCDGKATSVLTSPAFATLAKNMQEEMILAALKNYKQQMDSQSQAEIMSLAQNIDPEQLT